jgi:UDP-N-acetylmuramate dehydrogenase
MIAINLRSLYTFIKIRRMKIFNNVQLKQYNTFGIIQKAKRLVQFDDGEDLSAYFRGDISEDKPLFILGGGSNLLFVNDYKGTLIQPLLGGIKIEEKDHEKTVISAGAGLIWDEFVHWLVEKGIAGLENLSLIPGNTGAAPVQNIGAYGVEVSEFIERVDTICTIDGRSGSFNNIQCRFGYRTSIFKKEEKGNYIITRVYFKIPTSHRSNLGYGSLREEVNKLGSETPDNIRQAVIKIRRSRLPDPRDTGNAGSFFKNPFIDNHLAEELKSKYDGIPLFKDNNGKVKVAAGWLIERCGWKGKRTGNVGVHEKQALVIINYGSASGKDIYDFSESVKLSVYEKFGIELEREVEIVGTI